MGIFLIICIIIALLWPQIMKWLRSYMTGKAEDMMRRAMGMPSRKEERRRRKEEERKDKSGFSGSSSTRNRGRRYHRPASQDAAAIMKDVAVDVEYTEIKEFESTKISAGNEGREQRIYREEQVSDVEYIEIKESGRP